MTGNNHKATEQSKKGSFLWEVKGGNAKMYLKGAVHMVPKSFFPLKDEIMNSFDECRNYVLEVELDKNKIEGIKITNDIIYNKEYIYEDGDSLYNHFPKYKIMKLRDDLVNNNICSREIAKKFYKLKPIVVQALIHDGIIKKMGIDQECIGIDYYFMKRAKEMGKNIIELETIEYQEEILSKVFNKTEIINKDKVEESVVLDSTTQKLEESELSILDKGWLSRAIKLKMYPWVGSIAVESFGNLYGNEEKIIKKKNKLPKDSPLLGNRDEEMCNKVERYLKTNDSYFVAVGAAHLLGEGGIVDRLKKKGYEVIRIC